MNIKNVFVTVLMVICAVGCASKPEESVEPLTEESLTNPDMTEHERRIEERLARIKKEDERICRRSRDEILCLQRLKCERDVKEIYNACFLSSGRRLCGYSSNGLTDLISWVKKTCGKEYVYPQSCIFSKSGVRINLPSQITSCFR